jgi:CO dehydrogenase maturation factor
MPTLKKERQIMLDPIKNGTKIIAMCGKGGVGKTSLSAAIVKILTEDPTKKVLAIDADPAVGLATSLGMEVTKTVDDIRNDLISRVISGSSEEKTQMVSRLDYEMLTALVEEKNLAFLAIGRPEKEGCYCQVNHILKDIIASIVGNFDYVVIDGEAGVEQVNRRVMEKVTHLILVSDASAKGLNVVQTINRVSDESIEYKKSGLILNRLRSAKERDRVTVPEELNYLGWVPEDDVIRNVDIEGDSILKIDDCEALQATRTCLAKMDII